MDSIRKSQYDRSYYLKNRDKILARKRDWHSKLSPEKRKAISTRNKLRLYGATTEDYHKLVAQQGGACAICGVHPFDLLHVDHCHTTGQIRGLLCLTCNAGIGLLRDNPDLCHAAGVYLATTSAKAA